VAKPPQVVGAAHDLIIHNHRNMAKRMAEATHGQTFLRGMVTNEDKFYLTAFLRVFNGFAPAFNYRLSDGNAILPSVKQRPMRS
jgi:hypothetical protein